jgi:gentisate 1,2-dioxygenase
MRSRARRKASPTRTTRRPCAFARAASCRTNRSIACARITRSCGSRGATCGKTLSDLAQITPRGERVHLAYVNPETGRECMSTLGFSALMLRPGEDLRLPRRSASSVLHAVEGQGTATVDGVEMAFVECDTFAAPTHADIRIANGSTKSPAYLFMVDDAPLHRKLGFYEVFD